MADDMDRVVPLDELDDYEVADGEPDVRGWDVLAADGRKIGEVDDLLVDTAAMKVRYLDVDLEEDLVGATNDDRHILIPIGYAELHRDQDQILVSGLNSTDVGALPAYTHEPLTRDYENTLRQRFDRGFTAAPVMEDTEYYAHNHFDENRFYGARRSADVNQPDASLSERESVLGVSERVDTDRPASENLRRDAP